MWSVVAVCGLAAFIALVAAFENNYDPCNPNDDYYVKGGHKQLCPGTRTNPGSGVCEYSMNNNLGLDYKCVCQPGYRNYNQRQCIDVDECLGTPCPTKSYCINTKGSYRCACVKGYTFQDATSDSPAFCEAISQCSTKPEAELCGNSYGESQGYCEDIADSFICSFTCDTKLHDDGFVADDDYEDYYNGEGVWSDQAKYTEERPPGNYAYGGPNDDNMCVRFPTINIDTIIPIEGRSYTLNCSLDESWSYYDTDRINVDWFRNGQKWKPSRTTRQEAIVDDASIGVHDETFTCIISGVRSDPLFVELLHPSAPNLKSDPANGRVCIGRTEVLICSTTNVGLMQYRFFKNNVAIGTQTQGTYTIDGINASHAGLYTCVIIMNGHNSSSSNSVDLFVQDTVSKTVAVDGLEITAGIQWDESLEDTESVKYMELSGNLSEHLASLYNTPGGSVDIRNIQFRNESKTATYDVVFIPSSQPDTSGMDADLRQSSAGALGNLSVNYDAIRHRVRPFSPCLSVLPSDIQIGSGNVVTFTCSSQYTGPTVEYRFMRIWYSETSIRGSQDNDKFIIGDDSIGNDDGDYTCVVIVDGLESAVSTSIPLDVLNITRPVLESKYDLDTMNENRLYLNCNPGDVLSPNIEYEYKKVTKGGTIVWKAEGITTIDVLVGIDDGVYSCTTVMNGVYSQPSLPVTVDLRPRKPHILIVPPLDNGQITRGTRVTMYCYVYDKGYIPFVITEKGDQPRVLDCQKSNKRFVSGDESIQTPPGGKYVIQSVQPGDEGHFRCKAVSAAGQMSGVSSYIDWNGVKEVTYLSQACTARLVIKGGLQWQESLGDFRSDEFDELSAELTKELLKFYKKFPGFRRLINFQFRNAGNVEVTYDVEFVKWDHMTPDMMTFDLKAEYQSTKFKEKYDIDINEISHHDKEPKQAVPEREIIYDMKLVAIIVGAVIVVAIIILCLNTVRLVRKDAAEHRKLATKRKTHPRRRRISSLGTTTVPFAGIDLDRYAMSGASPLSASDVRSAGHVNTSPLPPASADVGSHGNSEIPPWAEALIRSTTEANSALVRSNHELIRPIIESNQRTEAYMRSTEAYMRSISETNTALVRSINESNNSLHSKLDRVLLTDATHL